MKEKIATVLLAFFTISFFANAAPKLVTNYAAGVQAQTINFPALISQNYGSPDFLPGATSSSGLPVTYSSSNTAVASIVDGKIHIVGAGSTTITAYQAGNDIFAAAANVTRSLYINKISQTITFEYPGVVTYGDPDFYLNATASSGLPITYTTSSTGIISITPDGKAHVVGSGYVDITAHQPGNSNYFRADNKGYYFKVNKLTQTLDFSDLAPKIFGDPDFVISATASTGLPVTFKSSNTKVATIVNDKVHIVGGGVAYITASQAGTIAYDTVSVTRKFTINPAPQSISFPMLADKYYEDVDFSPAAASSGLPIIYTSNAPEVASVVNGKIHIQGAGNVTITASQGGNANFGPADSVSRFLTIKNPRSAQIISFPNLAYKAYSEADFSPGASSNSGLPISYSSSKPSVATIVDGKIRILAPGRAYITASQLGDAIFAPALSLTDTLVVGKGTQFTTFPSPGLVAYGVPDFQLNASTSSGLVNTYRSSNASVITVTTEGMAKVTGVGTVILTAYQEGDAYWNRASAKSINVTVVKGSQTITLNDIPPKSLGDADFEPGGIVSSGLPVTYLSSDPSVATFINGKIHIVGPGNTAITAGQGGNEVYLAATYVTRTFNVINRQSTTLVFSELPRRTLNDTCFALEATSNNPEVPITFESSEPDILTVSFDSLKNKWLARPKKKGYVLVTARQVQSAGYYATLTHQYQYIDRALTPPQGGSRLVIAQANPDRFVGQNFTPWINDDLNDKIAEVWENINYQSVDVKLRFDSLSRVSRVTLLDGPGKMDSNKPAYVYAQRGSTFTYIGKFDGEADNEYIDFNVDTSVIAEAIVIRKYGNNMPLKVQAYGYAIGPKTIADSVNNNIGTIPTGGGGSTGGASDTVKIEAGLKKIPIDGKRWYILNNSETNLEKVFDGITDQSVHVGWGQIRPTYDCYYPLEAGEEITVKALRFYDSDFNLGDRLLTVSVITSDWKRIPIARTNGNGYYEWLGTNPASNKNSKVDSVVQNARYLVINTSANFSFPSEIEFYGDYKAGTTPNALAQGSVKLSDALLVNAFEWDFEKGGDGFKLDTIRTKGMKSFSGIRHYIDWMKLEPMEGSFTYAPTYHGGWNYDAIYKFLKKENMEVLACIKTIPRWIAETYPALDWTSPDKLWQPDGIPDRDNEGNYVYEAEYAPVRNGSSLSSPDSYKEQAKVAFQFAARYGANASVDPSLVSVRSVYVNQYDSINVVKIGMNLVKYIECDNERDKWWKGPNGYQDPREYAANLSAFYDGHLGSLGPAAGVKNADPGMQVVMAGLAAANVNYVQGMVDWCREHRGLRPDGSVNLCWDVNNYHYYSSDDISAQGDKSTRGKAPELSYATTIAKSFVDYSAKYLNNMPVWITEQGFDLNEGSPLNAIPIGNKSVEETQGDWLIRSALMYNRLGISKTFAYQATDNNREWMNWTKNPSKFGTSGLLDTAFSRRPAADYFYQTKKQFGNYVYKETLSENPIVDRYELAGNSVYIMYVPNEVGATATYQLSLDTDSANIYRLQIQQDSMALEKVALQNGKLNITLTETPVFVTPGNLISNQSIAAARELGSLDTSLNGEQNQAGYYVYPNPVTKLLNVTNPEKRHLAIALFDLNGRLAATAEAAYKDGTIDVSGLPSGTYIIKAKDVNSSAVIFSSKFIKN